MPENDDTPDLEHSFRIQLNERWEIDYWTRTLGVSEEILRKIVDCVGCDLETVRAQLQSD